MKDVAEDMHGSAPSGQLRYPERQRKGFGIDGVSGFMGMRWEDPQTVRLQIRPELINAGGLLSGVATFALVDYCMGSTLWAQRSAAERIATINISINYIQTATEGEITCRTELDRRNKSSAVMRSEVRHEDGRLLATAIGSYAIFVPRRSRGGVETAGASDAEGAAARASDAEGAASRASDAEDAASRASGAGSGGSAPSSDA